VLYGSTPELRLKIKKYILCVYVVFQVILSIFFENPIKGLGTKVSCRSLCGTFFDPKKGATQSPAGDCCP